MSDRFSGAFFDLSLDLGGGRGVVDNDAELIVVDEEAAGGSLSIGVERDGLDGEITNVTPNDHANETEEATLH
jgi:hypothetical protein